MKEKRRRDKLPPRPVIVELIPLTLKPRELNQITERCSLVLLAIEKTLVQCAREETSIDDEVVRQGLACSIRHTVAESDAAGHLISQLAATRLEFSVSDEDWELALRAICTSVTNHRKKNAGSFSYLIHAREFQAKANSLRQ